MTRNRLTALLWLLPLAGSLSFVWLRKSDACFDTHLENALCSWLRTVSVDSGAASADAVVVENPYCYSTCDTWLVSPNEIVWADAAGLVLLSMLIGALTAWRFVDAPVRWAAAVMGISMSLVAAIYVSVFFPEFAGPYGRAALHAQLLFAAMTVIASAVLAMLSALAVARLRRSG